MPYKQPLTNMPVFEFLQTPVLTDEYGLPRYWVTVWASMRSNNWAPSTGMKTLRYVEALYTFSDELNGVGYLDDVLAACDVERLGSILEAYFISLKNRPSITEAAEKQWRAGLTFVRDVLRHLCQSGKGRAKLDDIEARLLHLDALYSQLHITKSKRPKILRSLPAAVVSELYEILDPESTKNPFVRTRVRWSVYIAFILMLHQGLRRGEALLLPVNAVKSEFDNVQQRQRYWINVHDYHEHADQDTRYNRPSVKNPNSVRQLPVSEFVAVLIQAYCENYRGKPEHPFLINTQWNTPLSQESLTKYFDKLSITLHADTKKILTDITVKTSIESHDLRHTCAVVRLNQLLANGFDMDEALPKMRAFFGWSITSDMPLLYSRAVFEDRLSGVWSKITDDRVEILRSIPKGY